MSKLAEHYDGLASQYDKLDAAIIKAIRRGKATFSVIERDGAVSNEAASLRVLTGSEPFRIVDRRMQALRKAGRIVYAKRAWSVVEAA